MHSRPGQCLAYDSNLYRDVHYIEWSQGYFYPWALEPTWVVCLDLDLGDGSVT